MDDIKTVVDGLVKLARGAADATAVKFGTVLSRNPDGSLNVDDGQGGCARHMPVANVRVGEKIPIGTEPALGTVTSLSPEYFPIPSVSTGCPIDPRNFPEIPHTQPSFYGVTHSNSIRTWAGRHITHPADISFPFSHSAGSSSAGVANQSSTLGVDTLAKVSAETGGTGPYVNSTAYFVCHRNFIRFDRPQGVFLSLRLEFSVDGLLINDNTQFGKRWSPDSDSLVVVPAFPAAWPPTIDDWNAIDLGTALATRSIMASTVFGQTNYGVSIPLNVDGVNDFSAPTDPTITFCLVSAFDYSGAVPPHNTVFPSANGGVFGPDGYGDNRGNWLHAYVPPTSPTPTDDEFPRLIAAIADL